jgi:hypothetical protein
MRGTTSIVGEGTRPELGQTFKLTPDQRIEESHSTTI